MAKTKTTNETKKKVVETINQDSSFTTTVGTGDAGKSITINPPMSYGWVCPKCGRVNAPWKSTCDCYNGIATPYTPPNTPQTTPYEPIPYYNPPIETPNPYDPYGPSKWGDAPGWWSKGPTCGEGKVVFEIEYPDGHREKCPPNYFSGFGTPIPCFPTVGDPNFGKSTIISTAISQPGGNSNIKAYNNTRN